MEPGSWAEWVGAVATSVTFIGGAYLWRKDVKAKSRQQADRFTVIPYFVGGANDDDWTLSFYAHNGSDYGIIEPKVAGVIQGEYKYVAVLAPVPSLILEPGQTFRTEAMPLGVDPEEVRMWVEYGIMNGEEWRKGVGSKSYVSDRQKKDIVKRAKKWKPGDGKMKYRTFFLWIPVRKW